MVQQQLTRPGKREQSCPGFFVEKMLLGPSHGTQALSECQTNFSDDFGTLKNDLKKSFGPRAFYRGDQFYFGRIGSPDFMIFRCDLAHLVILLILQQL